MKSFRCTSMLAVAALCVFAVACAKKQVAVAPPPPPPAGLHTAPGAASHTDPRPRRRRPQQTAAQHPVAVSQCRYARQNRRADRAAFRTPISITTSTRCARTRSALLNADSKELATICSSIPTTS